MLATDPGGPKHHRRAQPLVEPVDPRAAAAAAECHLRVRTPCPAPAPTSSPWSPPRCQNDSLRRLWRVNASLLESQPSRSILLLGSSLDRNALAFLCEADRLKSVHHDLIDSGFTSAAFTGTRRERAWNRGAEGRPLPWPGQ